MKLFTLLILFSLSQASTCDNFYFNKPTVPNNHLTICNDNFVTEYNPNTKTPYYSADVLTKDIVNSAKKIGRKNTFHEEKSIDPLYRSTLRDYQGSKYDRGHVVPCDDMPNMTSQNQSFSLSNMVPQNIANNRGVWKKLENEARAYTNTEPKVYIISGPIYDNYNNKIGNNVIVPTRLFKIIYLPTKNKTLVYIVNNSSNSDINTTTIVELQKVIPLKFQSK